MNSETARWEKYIELDMREGCGFHATQLTACICSPTLMLTSPLCHLREERGDFIMQTQRISTTGKKGKKNESELELGGGRVDPQHYINQEW